MVEIPSQAERHVPSRERGPVASEGPATSWFQRVMRTPLLTKLVLLDLVINLVALLVTQRVPPHLVQQVTALSLGTVLVFNAGLVAWALQPLAVLEDTARRVSSGEFTARARMQWLADRNLVRIGDTLNALLDRVDVERRRVRALVTEVVAAGDRERAHIARELHDGTAQSLSALDMLMATAIAEHGEEAVGSRLVLMREIVTEALAEVRALSHNVHPRVLDDLGLPAALDFLARRVRAQSGVEVEVHSRTERSVPAAVASVLYRVAQEATHNAVKHGPPGSLTVRLDVGPLEARLEVRDEGPGFALAAVEAGRKGMGLFVMEERVALVDGHLDIETAPGRGTVVRAFVPLAGEAA